MPLAALGASAAEGGDPRGLWLTEERDAVVELRICDAHLCGNLYAFYDPKVPANATDVNNKRPELRTRPICDLPILGNLQKQPNGAWGGGWVYDPKAGKTYSVEVSLKDPKTLLVHGYVGVKFAGKTVTWTRVDQADQCARPGT